MPTRKLVNFTTNEDDFQCALYGAMGFSSKFIRQQTGLSFCQIGYRLKKASISRADYRNGKTKVAKLVLRAARATVEPRLNDYYRLKQLTPAK
jgi:hypothetical protein